MSEVFVFPEDHSVFSQSLRSSVAIPAGQRGAEPNDTASQRSKTLRMRILKILIGVLGAVLLAELVLFFIVIPCTAPISVTFDGAKSVQTSELLGLLDLQGNETWISCDSAVLASRLAASPLFETVRVEKVFPDQIRISVKERAAAAVALTEIDGRTVPVQIDRNGVLFRIGEGVPAGNVPLITGLSFDNPRPGLRLHPQLRSLMEQLAVLQEADPAYLSSLSEIRIEPKSYGGYDLVLYPVYSHTRVRTDKTLNEQSLQHMMVILDVLASIDPSVDEVDLRNGVVSYRIKEAGR